MTAHRQRVLFFRKSVAFGVGLLCLLANTAAAADRHVAPGGSDKAAGSESEPWKTLDHALAKVQPGDVIHLAAGKYAGGVKTRCDKVTITGPAEAIVEGPANGRGIEVLHDGVTLSGFTVAGCDIGIWMYGVSDCLLEGLTVREMQGEGLRIKNGSTNNIVRRCTFQRMGLTGFDAAKGKKNGEGIYIGTAPEQRTKNGTPPQPDRCTGNIVEDCTFRTEAAEAVDIKEDSEGNIVRRCIGTDSRDPDGPIFGSRGDSNRFEDCTAIGGRGHGFRFGGDTVEAGQHGQQETRTYGKHNVMRNCVAKENAFWGAAPMVKPQDIDDSNTFESNGRGDVKP